MADAFSSSSETAIQRLVDVTARTNTPVEKLQESYQIRETCDFISERHFEKVKTSCLWVFLNVCSIFICLKATLSSSLGNNSVLCLILNVLQVALQFPDELLADSVAIAQEIERNTKAKSFILGDTSYGR